MTPLDSVLSDFSPGDLLTGVDRCGIIYVLYGIIPNILRKGGEAIAGARKGSEFLELKNGLKRNLVSISKEGT